MLIKVDLSKMDLLELIWYLFYEITSLDDKWNSVKVIDFCKAHDLAPLPSILRRKREGYNPDMADIKWIKNHLTNVIKWGTIFKKLYVL